MQMQQFYQKLRTSLLSGTPGIFLLGSERAQIRRLLQQLQLDCQIEHCLSWQAGKGWLDREQPGTPSPELDACLASLQEHELEDCLIVLYDARMALEDSPAAVNRLRQLLESVSHNHVGHSAVILVGDYPLIPPDLSSRITLLPLPLPDQPAVMRQLPELCAQLHLELPERLRPALAAALCGLGSGEMRKVLRMATLENNRLDSVAMQRVRAARAQIISRSGLLELIEPTQPRERIGGLENLKQWLEQRARIFRKLETAVCLGVPVPRSLLIAGMPGCGKSMMARMTAQLFGLPLLHLNTTRLKQLEGADGEQGRHQVQNIIDSLAPCILWIDELERLFATSHQHMQPQDRLVALFNQWMTHHPGRLFVVATANDLQALPEELLRQRRFDEVFFAALPCHRERRLILEIHLQKARQRTEALDLDALAELCQDYSGADIQHAVKDALTRAFLEDSPLTQALLAEAIRHTTPLRESHREQVLRCERLCERLHLRPASLQSGPSLNEMYRMVSDPNHLLRMKVASSPDCPQELLAQLAGDSHEQVLRAVLRNPRCPPSLLSQRINIPHSAADYSSLLLALACCHRHTPLDLVISHFDDPTYRPDKEAMQLIAANALAPELHWQVLMVADSWPSQPRGHNFCWHDYDRLRYLLASNPKITERIQLRLAEDSNWSVRRRLAQHPALSKRCIEQLAGYKDLLVDDALGRNPALHDSQSIRLLIQLGVHEIIPVSQITPSDPGASRACRLLPGCILGMIEPQEGQEQPLLRPTHKTTGSLLKEPYLIAPLSENCTFHCPQSGCHREFTYTRTAPAPLGFNISSERISYSPHIMAS